VQQDYPHYIKTVFLILEFFSTLTKENIKGKTSDKGKAKNQTPPFFGPFFHFDLKQLRHSTPTTVLLKSHCALIKGDGSDVHEP
jgi:hypothetical protein